MRNRAKCKLCGEVLESFHMSDFVQCKCKEISIDGGLQHFKAAAREWCNFLRIDDDDNEIAVTFVEKGTEGPQKAPEPTPEQTPEKNEADSLPSPIDSKEELIKTIDEMLGVIERLPIQAQTQPVTHYDYVSILLLIKKVLVMNGKG